MKLFTKFLAIILVFPSILYAQNSAVFDGWKLTGHLQSISMYDGRDFNNKTYAPGSTNMKTRLGLEKSFGEDVDFVVKFQDSRVWGQHANVGNPAASTYFLEAYARINNIFGIPLSLQAGRFQVQYAGGRFLGISGWSYTERTHDGMRLSYKMPGHTFDLFGLNYASDIKTQMIAPHNPATLPYEAIPISGRNIIGASYHNKYIKNHNFMGLWYWDKDNKKSNDKDYDLDMHTLAFHYWSTIGKLKPTFDFGIQTGTLSTRDISAYSAFLKLTYSATNKVDIIGGVDLFSGTDYDETEKWNTFNNVFASKHVYNGLMDYFANARGAYGAVGVNGFFGGMGFHLDEKKWYLELIGHYFTANAKTATDNTDFGTELDFIVKYNIAKGIFVEWGTGVFLPGEYMKDIYRMPDGRLREDPSFMSYGRITVNI